MTNLTVAVSPSIAVGPSPNPTAAVSPKSPRARLASLSRPAVGACIALIAFSVFLLLKGANPLSVLPDMARSTLTHRASWGNIAIRACPLVLAALAVTVPSRAGLVNVGGEGQLLFGALAGMGVALALHGQLVQGPTLVLMALGAAAGGAALAGLAVALRVWVGINEAVTTLLLNYIALNAQRFLIFDKWKNRQGSGQPATRALTAAERLPILTGRVHAGVLVALGAVIVVAVLFARTRWGFKLRVVGGNAEAARRAGMSVNRLIVTSMLVGGSLAGLGGFAQLAGSEFTLRQGFLATYGYTAFLASWLGRHRPVRVLFAALLLAALAVGGDSLQLDSKLPAASVNVLIALVLLGAFGMSRRKAVA
jgi:general nucleoside transport system permease protein